MLDDIGLGAALDFLADEASTPGIPLNVEIEDATSLERTSRPPAGVELALYRIVREAVANSNRHPGAKSITIGGRIALDAVDLVVADDGVGIRSEDARRASGRGRLGLASMRRRAQGIGAELTVGGGPAGTRVVVSWRA
jgi:two-component system NarL family sensor kinase